MTMKMHSDSWAAAQQHEAGFWGNCLNLNTWHEFVKQEMYGREMQLIADYGSNGEYDMQGKSVLDIGGGPVSMMLRCFNSPRLTVADPMDWPAAVRRRYLNYGIEFICCAGENLLEPLIQPADEVWIYNVLQHVIDPKVVLMTARHYLKPGGRLRIFEWLNIPADDCHPHVLTSGLLSDGLAGLKMTYLNIPRLNEYWTPNAEAYVGVFTQ
jgi:2-polyprenyl-3-methyl-5-hydroxy-6-metoxy-1,4-benzoquinol methylase